MAKGRKKLEDSKFFIKSHFNEVAINYVKRMREEGNEYYFADLYDDLVEYTGLSVSSFISMRAERLNPSLMHGIKIAEFFNLPITSIWEVEENKSHDETHEKCSLSNCHHTSYVNGYCVKHYNKSYGNA